MPVNWSADHRPCWFLVCFLCVFWVFLSVLVGFGFLLFAPLSYTVTAQWIMYWSYSVPFCMYIVVMTDVAIALIRWICKLQLSFRLDDLARAIWRWTEKKCEPELRWNQRRKQHSESPQIPFATKLVASKSAARLPVRNGSICLCRLAKNADGRLSILKKDGGEMLVSRGDRPLIDARLFLVFPLMLKIAHGEVRCQE